MVNGRLQTEPSAVITADRWPIFVCELIVRKGDRTDMTEYASRETKEVMTERFPQRDGHLSLIGIRSKIDQEFLMRERSSCSLASSE